MRREVKKRRKRMTGRKQFGEVRREVKEGRKRRKGKKSLLR